MRCVTTYSFIDKITTTTAENMLHYMASYNIELKMQKKIM